MQLVDTHCHIHEILGADNGTGDLVPEKWHKAGVHDADLVIANATKAEVTKLICVGCTLQDSRLAVEFVQNRPNCWTSIGIHPHEAKEHLTPADKKAFADLLSSHETLSGGGSPWGTPGARSEVSTQGEGWADRTPREHPKIVAIGECGLDYYYEHSPKEEQIELLHFQLALAEKHNLPVIFHVRDAFDDFWPIYDTYRVRGVIHSFSATSKELDQILKRNLLVGLNGIMTFTKNADQLAAAKAIPLDKLLLETDAPFLTPHPYRGTICEPRHIRVTAEFLANLRGESLADVAEQTTKNAHKLFGV